MPTKKTHIHVLKEIIQQKVNQTVENASATTCSCEYSTSIEKEAKEVEVVAKDLRLEW